MTAIYNSFTNPVIKADDRDPEVSWQNHVDRGSPGGVDLAYPYGTDVKSPADGYWSVVGGNGSGGRIGQLRLNDGRIIEFMHLSKQVKATGWVKAFDVIAQSGASGFGKDWYYDPHLHVHIIDAKGVRRNLFNYFSPAPAGLDFEEIIMATVAEIVTGVWSTFKIKSPVTGNNISAADALASTYDETVKGKKAAERAESAAEKAVTKLDTLSSAFETEHPDPEQAAKGVKHNGNLLQRVGAIHVDTWLIPKLYALVVGLVDSVAALGKPSAVTVEFDPVALEAVVVKVLDARGLTVENISENVARRLYQGPAA